MINDVICYWKMTSFMALNGVTSFDAWKLYNEDFKICFRRLLCNKIEIDQLKCVICCVLGNYNRIISDALEKQNRNGKNTRSLILVTNIHRQARASQ